MANSTVVFNLKLMLFFLLVGPLVISSDSESMLVRRNSNASFSCVVVDQNVNATFLWSRVDGEPLPSRAHGSNSSVLTIVGVREEDEGEYTCTASTEHETLTATILLTVYGTQCHMVLNSLSNLIPLHEILFKIFIGNRINLSVEVNILS